jgi:hypothetical protein
MSLHSTGLTKDEKKRRSLSAELSEDEENKDALSDDLLSEYWSEAEWAEQLRKSQRKVQRDRQRRIGAPYVLIGKTVYYPKDEGRAWVRSRIVRPVRRGG